ncbi:MAG TPA: hypothetical protein VNQ90_17705 [Chthoniobacteraceae bacterium]|nr:hypothetical protein [Chthoniobacteraceae bacterium]
MADAIEICNLALGKIGELRISALSEPSQPARFCALFYAQTRDEVLQAANWNFAIRRVVLSRLAETPKFGWAYQYQLPVDCLSVIQLNAWQAWEARDLYEIEGERLLTDQESAQLRYTARVEDSEIFPPLFVEALYTKLASKLAEPIMGSRSKAESLLGEYDKLVAPLAMKANAREGRSRRKLPYVESDLVRARYGV